MPASIPALVTPAMLKWARTESGYSPEQAAKRDGVPAEKLLVCEEEEAQAKPSIRQAQVPARLYHPSPGVFSLPQPPSLPPLAAEYRRLLGIESGAESPELRLAIRVMSQRREVMLQLSGEFDNAMPNFNLALHPSEPAEAAGVRMRRALGVTTEEQLEWANEWQVWRRWREAVEVIGALVFQFPKVDLAQVRGVA